MTSVKFEMNLDLLADALGYINRVLPGRTFIGLEICRGATLKVRSGQVTLSGTNMTIWCDYSYEDPGIPDLDISIPPDALKLFGGFAGQGKVAKVEINDGVMKLNVEKSKYIFSFWKAEDFPQMPKIEEKAKGWVLSLDELRQINRKVVPFCAANSYRISFGGVNFKENEGSFEVVGTDSYRLSRLIIEDAVEGVKCLLPAQHFKQLAWLIDEDMQVVSQFSGAFFITSKVVVYIIQLNEEFVDYDKIVNQTPVAETRINGPETVIALGRLSFLDRQERDFANRVFIKFNKDEVRFRATGEIGEAEEVVSADGADLNEIAFNRNYFLEAARLFNGEILLLFHDQPGGIFFCEGNFMHLSLPMTNSKQM